MTELTITAVACQAKVRPSTLRYYERIGLLPRVRRVGGRRSYDASVLRQLALIAFAKKAGFQLKEIQALQSRNLVGRSLSQFWRRMAEEKKTSLDLVIAQAQRTKGQLEVLSQCRCRNLEGCGRRIVGYVLNS